MSILFSSAPSTHACEKWTRNVFDSVLQLFCLGKPSLTQISATGLIHSHLNCTSPCWQKSLKFSFSYTWSVEYIQKELQICHRCYDQAIIRYQSSIILSLTEFQTDLFLAPFSHSQNFQYSI